MLLSPARAKSFFNTNYNPVFTAGSSSLKPPTLSFDTVSFKGSTETTLSEEEINEFKKELEKDLDLFVTELKLLKPSLALLKKKSRYNDEMGNYIFNFNLVQLYSDILINKDLKKVYCQNDGKKELLVAYDGMPEIVDEKDNIRMNYLKKYYNNLEFFTLTKEDRKNMLITTLYHELIHAKQLHLIVATEGLGLDKAFGTGTLAFITKNIILRSLKKQQNSIPKDSLEGKKAYILFNAKGCKDKSGIASSLAYANDPYEVDAMFITLNRFKNNSNLCKQDEASFKKAYDYLESEYTRLFEPQN